jgi:hypothetical protein
MINNNAEIIVKASKEIGEINIVNDKCVSIKNN